MHPKDMTQRKQITINQWLETNDAAAELGLTPRQLRKLRSQLKLGKHYRCKNPQAARKEYLWNASRIEQIFTVEDTI